MFKRMIAFAAALVCGVLFAGCARPSADVGAAEVELLENGKMTDGAFWAVYTSLGGEYADASWGTFEYEGRVLASATLGVSGLPLEKGAYFALVYTVY